MIEPGNKTNDLESEKDTFRSVVGTSAFQNEISIIKSYYEFIPTGIAIADEDGKQVYVNLAFCKMLGWDEEDLLGKQAPYVYWCSAEIENINNAFSQILDGKAPKEGFDLVFCHKNGKQIPVNVIISPIRQENGQSFFLANVINITGRKKTEDALMKSQLLLLSSIESQKGAIIFSTDRNYNYLYFNQAHRDSMMFAYNREIRTGMNILDCVTKEDDRVLIKENIDRALRGESGSIIQTFGDVNIAYYESFFNPILDEKNEIMGCTALARNITERIMAEQALRDSEIKFREIIDQINDMIIVFDEQGEILIWNSGAEQTCGLKAEEVIGKNIVDIQLKLTPPPNNNRDIIEKGINGILKQETPERLNQIIDSEIIALNSGNLRNIQSMVFPVKLNGNNLFCTVIRDTTEIKRYEKELVRVSSEKDKFYSMIAQYLYTPFNVFNNFSKLMSEELDNLPIREIQKMARMMSRSASNLHNLLDNLLQWTRMNQGKIPFEPQKLNLKKTSRDAVSIFKPEPGSNEFKVNHFMEDDVMVFADLFMLKTIIRNLVSCAVRFSNRGGEIDIFAYRSSDKIKISVCDNGCGIIPEYLAKMFHPEQIHSLIGAAEEKGTTLGLLLCKDFVEKHGGQIWIETDNDKGNQFIFTLKTSQVIEFNGH